MNVVRTDQTPIVSNTNSLNEWNQYFNPIWDDTDIITPMRSMQLKVFLNTKQAWSSGLVFIIYRCRWIEGINRYGNLIVD